jgi:hypothetical protein
LARTPNIKYLTLEIVYKILSESKVMYCAELWGLDEAWKEIDKVHGRFCKKLLRFPRCAANGRNGARKRRQEGEDDVEDNKILATSYAYGHQDPVRQCYECQKRNTTVESWTKKMKEEMEKIDLAESA